MCKNSIGIIHTRTAPSPHRRRRYPVSVLMSRLSPMSKKIPIPDPSCSSACLSWSKASGYQAPPAVETSVWSSPAMNPRPGRHIGLLVAASPLLQSRRQRRVFSTAATGTSSLTLTGKRPGRAADGARTAWRPASAERWPSMQLSARASGSAANDARLRGQPSASA